VNENSALVSLVQVAGPEAISGLESVDPAP
jgi:hypothetical protein